MKKKKEILSKQKSNGIKRCVSGSAPQSDISKYHKFIIVDKERRPMAWGGEQLCYTTSSHWQDIHFPVRVYSKKRAMELIRKSQSYRQENIDKYYLMPVVGAHLR